MGRYTLRRRPISPSREEMAHRIGKSRKREPMRHFTRLSYSPVRVSTLMISS
jgi:hypothetical protein